MRLNVYSSNMHWNHTASDKCATCSIPMSNKWSTVQKMHNVVEISWKSCQNRWWNRDKWIVEWCIWNRPIGCILKWLPKDKLPKWYNLSENNWKKTIDDDDVIRWTLLILFLIHQPPVGSTRLLGGGNKSIAIVTSLHFYFYQNSSNFLSKFNFRLLVE